jgi:hypothetical protein
MQEKLAQIQRDSNGETERLKLELDEMRENFTNRLNSEYIKIDRHEQLINEELSNANKKL